MPTLKFTTSLWSVCELGIANSAARAAFSRCSCRSSSLKHVRLCQANATKLGIWELFTWEFGIIFSKSKLNGLAAKLGSCAARIRIRWSSKWPHQCSCEGFIFMWQSYGTLALCSRAKSLFLALFMPLRSLRRVIVWAILCMCNGINGHPSRNESCQVP